MAGLEDAPEATNRVIVAGIVGYFVLIGVDVVIGSPLAALAAHVLFGFVAIGIGAVLITQSARESSLPTAAGVALVVGGIAQLAWVGVREPIFDTVATVAVLVGIVLYLYLVWVAE